MNTIPPFDASRPATPRSWPTHSDPARKPAPPDAPRAGPADEVDVSATADRRAAAEAERIAALRATIAAGKYATADKLDVVIERLWEAIHAK